MKTFSTFTDEMLVKSYEKGNNAAFEGLLYRHKDKFSAISTLLPTTGAYRGYIQETFIKSYYNLSNKVAVESASLLHGYRVLLTIWLSTFTVKRLTKHLLERCL